MMKEYKIDIQKVKGANRQFWKAAGSDFLYWLTLRSEGRHLLDRMAATGSACYLRNHYTFSDKIFHGVQVGGEVYTEDDNGNPVYNFAKMNNVYHEFVKRGLKPVVEFDFLPRELTIDGGVKVKHEGPQVSHTGPRDWDKWYNLIKDFTQNLVDTFGLEEVRTWYFEVWNEPDSWPVAELDTFFRMYDVFVHAVTSVDENLKVGGPACFHEHFLKPFLHHVAKGKNHVTGERGTRVDFISYHIYGISGGWLNNYPLVMPTVQRFIQQLLWLQRLINEYPELKDCQFHLNEWGVCSNWYRTVNEYPPLEMRNNEFSPLFLIKLVDSVFALEDNCKFVVSMMLYWGFAEEAAGEELFKGQRSLTTAGNIPKPIQTGHEMLSKMGSERLEVEGAAPGENVSLFATRTNENKWEFMAYNFNELVQSPRGNEQISVTVAGLENVNVVKTNAYCLDQVHNNTYRSWQKQGSPRTLAEADIETLKEAGTLSADLASIVKVEGGQINLRFDLPDHSMKLYEITTL